MEIIVQFFAELIGTIFGYCTARLLVPLLSFGSISVESWKEDIDKTSPKTFGMFYKVDGKLLLSFQSAVFVGLIMWLCVAIFTILMFAKFAN